MPGHHVGTGDSDAVEKDVTTLFEAIDEHDVVFLLTDTRESRWLPTMYCAYRGKVILFVLKTTKSNLHLITICFFMNSW